MKTVEIQNPPSVGQLIRRFGRRRLSFALDSAQSNDGLGEWSFFGADPFVVLAGKDGTYRVDTQSVADQPTGSGHLVAADGLELLQSLMAASAGEARGTDAAAPGRMDAIPFTGGAVGYLAYDYGRQIEQLPVAAADDRAIPDLHFGLYDGVAALNHKTGVLHLIALGIRAPEAEVIDELQAIVHSDPGVPEDRSMRIGDWRWNGSPGDFRRAVVAVREHIARGDVYQVNLSRRARAVFDGDPLELYQGLRAGNPGPYGAYLDTGDLKIISTSPEQFLRKRGRVLETRPIKGTCPRGETAEADRANAEALRLSEKDRAELLMIVDLERNDLGRVAAFGTVEVAGMYHQERYARVIHQTARVRARLAEDKNVYDAIRALFPGGSITGAPKIRAMEIIEALEPTRRGVYCGSLGYLGFDGDAEFNIAIRTLHLTKGLLDYQVGAGIVWDSEPEAEYQETMDKGRAIRETIARLCQKLP